MQIQPWHPFGDQTNLLWQFLRIHMYVYDSYCIFQSDFNCDGDYVITWPQYMTWASFCMFFI